MKLTKWKLLGVSLFLIVAIVSMLGLTACGGNESTTPAQTTQTTTSSAPSNTTATTTAAGEKKVLKVGAVSNFQTKEGLEFKKWYDLFQKRINAAGGWKVGNDTYELNLIVYDGGNMDDAKSRAAVEKLIYDDKVSIICGTFMMNDKQAAEICQQNGIILMGEGFTDDAAGPEFTVTYRTTGIYFGRSMNFNIAKEYYKQGSRKLCFINGNSEQSQTQIQQYGNAYKLAGFEVLDPVLYNSDTVDFGPIATKVKAAGADSVCFPDAGSSLAINIMGALYDAGWKGTIFPSSLNAGDLAKIYAKVGAWCDGMLGLYFDPHGIPAVMNNPDMKYWLDEYVKEYGTFVESGCLWVNGFWFLQDAVMNTKSVDPKVLQAYLDKSDHEVATLLGYAQLMARPDLKNYRTMDSAFSDGIAISKDGKFQFYMPDTVQDQYLASIKAYGLVDVYKAYWKEYGQPKFPKSEKEASFDYAWLDK
jgi:ABC-type branched-subunit amino acid transport system substrate-binding protein